MKVDCLSCQHCGEPVEPGEEAIDQNGMTTEYHPGQCALHNMILTEEQQTLIRFLYEVKRERDGCCGPDLYVREVYGRIGAGPKKAKR